MSIWGTLMAMRIGDHAPWRLKPPYVRAMSPVPVHANTTTWTGRRRFRVASRHHTAAAAAGVPGRDDVAGVHAAPGDGRTQGGFERARETGRRRSRVPPRHTPAAAAAGVPGRDDVAGVHAAPGDGGLQGGFERAVEAVRVRRPQCAGPGGRMHPGLPEDLVGQQVSHAGDPGLIEQPGLDRDRAPGDQATEIRRGDLGGVRPELVDAGVEPDPSEPALVEQDQAAAVGEAEREPVPLGLARLRLMPSRPAAFGRVAVPGGDYDPAAHTEVNAEVGPVPGGLAPHRLAPAAGRGERSAGQRGAQLTGGVRAADERVAVVDVRDAPAQRLVGNQAAGGLDLGEFRHSFVLPVPAAVRGWTRWNRFHGVPAGPALTRAAVTATVA